MSDIISLDELKRAHHKKTRRLISQDIVDVINTIAGSDGEDFASAYRDNFLSYSSVLKSGDFSTEDYINAVKFCSYKLLQHNNIDSYMFTFPDRYKRLMDKHRGLGDEAWIRENRIASFSTAYNRNRLVNKIMEQSLVPSDILNAPLHQEALNVQAHLMLYANSETVRSNAANSVLEHTKRIVDNKIKIDIGIEESDAVKELMESLTDAAFKQKTMLERGQVTLAELGAVKLKPEFTEAELDE